MPFREKQNSRSPVHNRYSFPILWQLTGRVSAGNLVKLACLARGVHCHAGDPDPRRLYVIRMTNDEIRMTNQIRMTK